MARTLDCTPTTVEVNEFITGHHVYKELWTPTLNEELTCEDELHNLHDRNAVKVVKGNEIVGHVPRNYSRVFTYVLFAGGNVTSIVTGSRQN